MKSTLKLSNPLIPFCSGTAEVEPEIGIEMLMVSMLKEPSQDLVFKIVAAGNSQVLGDILKKFPDRVKCRGFYLYFILEVTPGESDA